MRPIRALLFAVISGIVASVVAYVAFLRPRIRSWGFDSMEAQKALPGDDLVAEPTAVETRGITIDDTPDKVWPWLVQMGYGRGGWYSYEPLDSKKPSANEILPEFQDLKEGDMMPTYPGFSFEVKVVEPERAIVLFTDTALAKTQIETSDWDGKAKMQERMQEMPDFAASWGFYLEPQGADKSRLVERFRVQAPSNAPAAVMNEATRHRDRADGAQAADRDQGACRTRPLRDGSGLTGPERDEPVRVPGRRGGDREYVKPVVGPRDRRRAILVAQEAADRLAVLRVFVL